MYISDNCTTRILLFPASATTDVALLPVMPRKPRLFEKRASSGPNGEELSLKPATVALPATTETTHSGTNGADAAQTRPMMGAGTHEAVTVADGEAVLAMDLEGERESERERSDESEDEGRREGEREDEVERESVRESVREDEGRREDEMESEAVREGETGEAEREGVGTTHVALISPALESILAITPPHDFGTTTPKLEL